VLYNLPCEVSGISSEFLEHEQICPDVHTDAISDLYQMLAATNPELWQWNWSTWNAHDKMWSLLRGTPQSCI